MPECTKGPCDNPAVEELLVRDGGGHIILFRCEEHEEVETPMIEVLERRPPQQTLGEVVKEDSEKA